jgi:hypothetical protein
MTEPVMNHRLMIWYGIRKMINDDVIKRIAPLSFFHGCRKRRPKD